MNDAAKKKGIFGRLFKPKPKKTHACCGGYVIEPVKDDEPGAEKNNPPSQPKKPSCCG